MLFGNGSASSNVQSEPRPQDGKQGRCLNFKWLDTLACYACDKGRNSTVIGGEESKIEVMPRLSFGSSDPVDEVN